MKKVDHVGIAVSSLQDSLVLYTEKLGMTHVRTEVVESQGVNVAFIDAGNLTIELLEPRNQESPIAKFIEKRGQGLHHIAYKVESVDCRIEELKKHGIRFIEEQPKKGAGGAQIAFMHPKSTDGVLMELCEKKEEL